MAGLTIKVLRQRQKIFSYIVMQVIWCLKLCNLTKYGGQSPRFKFWGTCPHVIYAHAVDPHITADNSVYRILQEVKL